MTDFSKVMIHAGETLRQAMVCVDRGAKGIALVVEGERRLLYTITDGDLRRAILQGLNLEMTVEEWAKARTEQGVQEPTTALVGTPSSQLKRIMQEKGLRHIPLLNAQGCVVDLVLLNDLLGGPTLPTNAVLMAGGMGTRLRPLTSEVPKPMLPVGDRPLMEHIVTSLRDAGIREVSVTTHYKAEAIVQHFGNGEKFGLKMNYVPEDLPLGTAGALRLLPPWNSALLVVNGDILTRLNYESMLAFHRENQAVMTVAVREFEFQVPYGVVETDGPCVRRLNEKPTYEFFVNAGVYLLEPGVRRYLQPKERLDMPELITRLLADHQRVVSFPVSEYWLDVGQHADYQKAQIDFGSKKQSVS